MTTNFKLVAVLTLFLCMRTKEIAK